MLFIFVAFNEGIFFSNLITKKKKKEKKDSKQPNVTIYLSIYQSKNCILEKYVQIDLDNLKHLAPNKSVFPASMIILKSNLSGMNQLTIFALMKFFKNQWFLQQKLKQRLTKSNTCSWV